MSQNPGSAPSVWRALQTLAPAASASVSRPDELCSTLAGRAAVANRDSYGICFTWIRQVLN